jgi:uncharacterized protein (TIGR03083 family)
VDTFPASSRSTFRDAAATVADLVGRVPAEAWSGPGLGVWDLRALVGHTSRSLVTVATYFAQRTPAVEVPSPEAYYTAIAQAGAAGGEAVAERGRAAGAALGDEPSAAFRTLLDAASAALDQVADDDVVPTIMGGMRVADYLPTRTFELVVHGGDIGIATGLDVAFGSAALAEASSLAARVAVELGRGPALLAAMTGRASLPEGFSVV